MVKADITLKCSSVNSGTAVTLQGVELTYKWSNYLKVPDVPSKFAATDAQSVTNFMGWTNPSIVIRGIMDTNNSLSNGVTIALLKAFAKEKTNPIYIYEKDMFPVADTSKIKIHTFDLSKRKADDNNEGRVDYTISGVETL